MPAEPVLFTVTERFVNVHMKGVSVCQFGVDTDGKILLAFPNTLILDTIDLVEGSIVRRNLSPLEAEMIYQEMDPALAIPRYNRTKIGAPTPPTRQRIRVTENGQTISSSTVEGLIEAIVASYIEEPRQTKKRTAQITKELSERFAVPVMSIAGVRAALTRGAYNSSLDEMITEATVRGPVQNPS